VRKKVDAVGKFVAKIPGIEVGFWESSSREAMIPEDNDTIRKPC